MIAALTLFVALAQQPAPAAAMTPSPPPAQTTSGTPSPAALATPSSASSPTPGTTPAAAIPGATIMPPPKFPQRDPDGIIRYIFDAGTTPTIYCALGYQCAIEFDDGELITRTVILHSTEGPVWSVQPSNPDTNPDSGPTTSENKDQKRVAHIYISPLPSSPVTNLYVETTKRVYNFLLKADPRARGATYAFRIPDATNTVTLPIPIERTYKYGSDDTANIVAPTACPTHGYTQTFENNPAFRPSAVTVAEGVVTIDFSPLTPLPSVGAPSRDQKDITHLSLLPTSTSYAPDRRSLVILACYPTIVLYTNSNHGRTAVVLTSY